LGELRPCSDHDRVDAPWDRAQIVVAAIALNLVSVRVDREDLVASLAQALIHNVAPVALRLPGDARNRNPPVSQKRGCSLGNRRHCAEPPSTRRGRRRKGRPTSSPPPNSFAASTPPQSAARG